MERPNILIIHSDQYRFDAMGCAGNAFVKTPHLDRLAEEGIMFTRAYTTQPLCTPARASSWTGVYPSRHGLWANTYGTRDAFSDLNVPNRTLFSHLNEAGWTTAYIGKWHLGAENPGYFDHFKTFESLGGHWIDGYQASQNGQWIPDVDTDEAIRFMSEQKDHGPFCLTIGYYPPHDPYTAPTRFLDLYRGKGIPVPSYYACCSGIDHNVGRLMVALDDLNLTENTIVIFFSDHGDTFNHRDCIPNKWVCHEESVRIPWLMRYPKKISAGTKNDAFIGVQDLMPTILDYARLDIPSGLHGESLCPLIDDPTSDWRDSFYIENLTSRHFMWIDPENELVVPQLHQRCLRTDRWKLILSEDGAHSLYDLDNDPEEVLDIYGAPYEDCNNQFMRFESQEETIRTLAGKLGQEAARLDDEFGIRLAQKVVNNPIRRVAPSELQDAIIMKTQILKNPAMPDTPEK